MRKIQYGGHFSRWPPSGLLFHHFAQNHSTNCDTWMKFGRIVPCWSVRQVKVLAMTKFKMAAIIQDVCQTDLCFMILLKNHNENHDINMKFERSVTCMSVIFFRWPIHPLQGDSSLAHDIPTIELASQMFCYFPFEFQ